jgi:hypothetical protein
MRILVLILFVVCATNVFAQVGSKDWTAWSPVEGDWIQFQAVVNFHGGAKSSERLAKVKPESLKLNTLIGGRVKAELPQALEGVQTVKVIYSAYGRFETMTGFFENFAEISKRREDQNVNPVTIIRPATAFDIAEASKPQADVTVQAQVPNILLQLGVDPGDANREISGRVYRLESEWRRKGKTVEVRLKDYRPN